MKFTKINLFQRVWIAVAILALMLMGCEKDKEDNNPVPDKGLGEYAMVTTKTNLDGRTRAFYLQRVSVDNTESVDNSGSTQLSGATGAMMHSFGGHIYFSDYMNGKMEKWSIDTSNNATMEGSLNLAELTFQGNTTFKDANTAFVGGLSTNIVIFNPTTMQKTGTIDISSISKIGTVTDFPQADATIIAESVAEMVIRDNLLFAALMPLSSLENGQTPGDKGCPIVVIDLSKVDINAEGNTDAVVKRIYDDRGSATGAWGSGGGSGFMRLDEKGDIYMLCHNTWSGFRAAFDKPACILKIAAGTTDFDQNYYFDLESAARGNGSPVMNLEYYGNGKFLGGAQDPTALDPENPWSGYMDPVWQWWSFDLYNQTAELVTEEYTRAAIASVTHFENGFGYVPFEANGENFVMKVDLNTLESTKQFNTVGTPHLFSLQ